MVIEIPGRENSNKVEKLEEQLKGLFQNRSDIRVNRPVKNGGDADPSPQYLHGKN